MFVVWGRVTSLEVFSDGRHALKNILDVLHFKTDKILRRRHDRYNLSVGKIYNFDSDRSILV